MTLVSSGSIFGSEELNEKLPPIDERILAHHAGAATMDWSDENAVADNLVRGSRLLCGTSRAFNEQRAYEIVTTEIKRANNLLSMFNHALLDNGEVYEGSLRDIQVPTLVIHGSDDIVLPYQHALHTANGITNAKLLTLEGSGHEVHEDNWDEVIEAITAQVRNSVSNR